MIINRYLIGEISKPLSVVLGVLLTIFASYSAVGFLSNAVNGILPMDSVFAVIGLKILIALEVLIPISLYISVVLSLSKLYSDSELTAMFALRVTPLRVMGAVLTLSGFLALVVAGLSLTVRPWAYEQTHLISAHADATVNFNEMEAGTFYESPHSGRVIFIGQRSGPNQPAGDVFVQLTLNRQTQVIHAKQAYQVSPPKSGSGPSVRLLDAHIYQIGHGDTGGIDVLHGRDILLHLQQPAYVPPGYSSLAADSLTLSRSGTAADEAEFQWRLSTPLSTLLLGLLGLPLSRVNPRQSKYAKMGTAILLYSGYYFLCTSARTWVQKGVIPAVPGLWPVPGLLAVILAIALLEPRLALLFRRRST